MPDENDSRAADWVILWESVPETVRESIRTRWKTAQQQFPLDTMEPQDWRTLWAAAPDEIRDELRSRWTDERLFPVVADPPLTAKELRKIIDTHSEAMRPLKPEELRAIFDEYKKESLRKWKPSEWILTLFFIWLALLAVANASQTKLWYVIWYGTEC